MRCASTPREARYSRTVCARRAPSAMLYSRVPRSSAWPSTVKAYADSLAEPLRLLVERAARLRRQLGGIGLEEDAVADIDHEVLLAAGRRGAGGAAT